MILWIYNILFNLLHLKSNSLQLLLLFSGCVIILLLKKIEANDGSLSVWYYVWFLIGLLFFKYKSYFRRLIHNKKNLLFWKYFAYSICYFFNNKEYFTKNLNSFFGCTNYYCCFGKCKGNAKKNTNISNTYWGKYITCIWDTLVLIVFTCFSGEWISLYKKYVAIISECNTYINLVDCNL